jgi:lipopolysaccharide heptosyltransferase I
MTSCTAHEAGRILCIRLSGLGDVVHALCALSLLRQERPGAFIAWAVEERFADLLRGHPHVDALITVPRGEWGRMLRNPLHWPALLRARAEMAARVRAFEFDVSVDFQSSFKSTWLVRAARAKTRIGFGGRVNREGNILVQNAVVRVPEDGVHRIERDLMLLAPLGLPLRYVDVVLPSNEQAHAAARSMLDGRPVVVIHPGTSPWAAFKRWPPARYADVADRLVAERCAHVLVSCGPGERPLGELLLDHMSERATLVRGEAGLPGLIELLRHADLFIGSDTGPMHMASALKVPVVALFGPKDPVQTGPYCTRGIVVTAPVDCRPCARRRCSHARCMTQITVEQVHRAALDVLDGAGRCPATESRVLANANAARTRPRQKGAGEPWASPSS